ncbi:MAG: hypothetical protein Q9224_004982, partial [Gallowayella concinna]
GKTYILRAHVCWLFSLDQQHVLSAVGGVTIQNHENADVVQKLEIAINTERYSDSPPIKHIRREGLSHFDAHCREIQAKTIAASVAAAARQTFSLQQMTSMDPQEQDDWARRCAEDIIDTWTIPAAMRLEVDDVVIAAALALDMAYRRRIYHTDGEDIVDHVLNSSDTFHITPTTISQQPPLPFDVPKPIHLWNMETDTLRREKKIQAESTKTKPITMSTKHTPTVLEANQESLPVLQGTDR